MKSDIIIIGGGIIGSSIAYFLASSGLAGRVQVIERDSTYTHAATPRSNGGIRRLFSLPENIEMAGFGLNFYKNFASQMAVENEAAEISFRRQGYLFVSDDGGAKQMERNYLLQTSMGVEAEALTAAELSKRFPSIATDDVAFSVLSDHDGWIDPHAALMGFRHKAIRLGVEYVEGEAVAFSIDKDRVKSVDLKNGMNLRADAFVNACGAWCSQLAKLVDIHLPVEPMSRESYFLRCSSTLEDLPFIKTESDLAIRPEGQGYVGGIPDWREKPGWNFDVSADYFESVVWPNLARRLPAMQEIKLESSWRGHYARSTLDCSPILGKSSAGPSNFFMANGFSGHGIMHAPASGRALSELILHDSFQTLDLSCFAYQRILDNKPYAEQGIV